MSASDRNHIVAIVGGATAGAEVAKQLTNRGITVVAFEKNARPYGKIEDGLPRWHASQRRREYEVISGKLDSENAHFVPNTKIGEDIDFVELANDWGFSAIILACGAWADRKLDIEGAERFEGKELIYQNPFVHWFNHCNESDYDGQKFEVRDGAIVIGGGLASIDMVKIHTLELTRRALAERGIETTISDLEHKGIPKSLAMHELQWDDLGLQGCTLYYRRRVEDMPVMNAPPGASAEKVAKVEAGRRRMVEKAMEKYCFGIESLCLPVEILEDDGAMVGLKFLRTRIVDGRAKPTDESFEIRAPYVVSSVGSVPDPIPGIPMQGDLFDFSDYNLGTIEAFPKVFGAGNVVTGKGNIVASRKHSTEISQYVAEKFLGVSDGPSPDIEATAVAEAAKNFAEGIASQESVSQETFASILDRVRKRQAEVGYTDGYRKWIEKVTPADLE